jgi:hypothetical protein
MHALRICLLGALLGGCSSHASATQGVTDAAITLDGSRPDACQHLTLAGLCAPVDAALDAPLDAAHDAGGPHANGTLGPWQTLTPMPQARANHCSVAAGGYLVVIGGNYEPDGGSSFISLDAVHVAPLRADGSLVPGPWTQAGTTPSPVNGCTATASGSTIYLIDGIYDDMADQGHVFSAELSSSGTLGTWKNLGRLPNGQDAFSSQAWVASDSKATLYVMDSATSSTDSLQVATAPGFGTWTEATWLPGFLGRPEYAFTGACVYAMGGYLSNDGGNPTVTAVNGAPIEASGKIGASFSTTALPMPVTFGGGVAVDDWVFVIGGKTALFGNGETNTYSAQVGAGGQLGAWTAQAPLPEGRTDMPVTVVGDFLYVTGGGDTGPGVDTVYAAKIRF